MYRQSPNTNQRLKEMKVKHVWKICLLLGVCFWLIYQVKPSQYEKEVFDESEVEVSLASAHRNTFVKLGRKGVHSRVQEVTVEDVDGTKYEEDGLQDKKEEENETGGMDDGDETFDDAEVDRENSVVGKMEGEEGAENENIDDQMEKESPVEETDHDGDDVISHEAREEHYMADDASSAVSHENRMVGTENEKEHEESLDEQTEDILEHRSGDNTGEETNEGEKRKELEVEAGETVKDDTESTVTYKENDENVWSNHHSETSESGSGYVPEILTLDTSVEDVNLQDTDLEKANYSTLNVDDHQLDSESKGPDETRILESEGTENFEEIQQDSLDSSDSPEEKDTEDVGTDLDAIQTEDTNSEDAAAA